MKNREGDISSVKPEHLIAVLYMIECDIPTHGMQ